MQRTENYRLFKPESTDNGSPEPFNNNADVIDAELNRLSTGLSRVDDALVAAQDVLESGITSAKVSKLDALPTSTQLDGSLSSKANKSDITNISITGTTNNTGSNIPAGTLFYLNGTLCKALTDIASGATFTEGTNYIETTVNSLTGFSKIETLYSDGNGTVAIFYNDPNGIKMLRVALIDTLADNVPNNIQITDPKLRPHAIYHSIVSNYYDFSARAYLTLSGDRLTFISKGDYLYGSLLYF